MAGRILIVDDVATNRIVLKVRLSAALYDPVLAATGEDALRLARSTHPDLMLLDLQLPDIGGLQVLERLRADPATRDLPVIVHSSSHRPDIRLAALRAGADDVLHKPADDQL
jgi:two-component system cell cycle response regulator